MTSNAGDVLDLMLALAHGAQGIPWEAVRLSSHATRFLKDPRNPSNPLRLTINQLNLLDAVQLGIPPNLIFGENGLPHGNEILYDAARRHPILEKVFIEWPRQVGKTTSLGFLASLLAAFPSLLRTASGKHLETMSIGFFAPVEEKSLKLMDETRRNYRTSHLIKLLPKKKDVLFKANQMEMILTNFSELVAYNSSARSVRGGSHIVGIVDETGQIPKEFFETCVNATGYEIGERQIYSGTTEGVVTYHYELKAMSQKNSMRICAQCGDEWDEGAFTHQYRWNFDPDTDTLFKYGGMNPPCPSCKTPHDDEHFTFSQILPIVVNPWIRMSKPPRWVWDELQRWDNDPLIRQELLCEEMPAGNLMYPKHHLNPEWPNGCYAPWLGNGNAFPQEKKVAGIDLGKHRDHTALLIVHREEDGTYAVDFAKRWRLKIDYHDVRIELQNLLKMYNVTEVVLDTLNAGESTGDEMKHDLEGTEIIMYEENGELGFRGTPTKKKEILQYLQYRVVNHHLKIPNSTDPDIAQLLHEMETFSYKKIQAKSVSQQPSVSYGVQTGPDDMVLALAMALRGFKGIIYPSVTPKGVRRVDDNPVLQVREATLHGFSPIEVQEEGKGFKRTNLRGRSNVASFRVRRPKFY